MTKVMRLLAAAMAASALPVCAEYGVMTAGNDYCKAEIRAGQYGTGNPESLPLRYGPGPVRAGTPFQEGEGVRICARREGTPNNCASAAGPWLCVSPTAGISEGTPVRNTY
jgi:hypothetical protein